MNENILEVDETDEAIVLDGAESSEGAGSVVETVDEIVMDTELVVLQRIEARLEHIDSVAEYSSSLLIIFMLVLILNYVYKFFRMFF